MTNVVWLSAVAKRAQVWRVLDLSGMTNSVRQSRDFTKSGWVFVNNRQVRGLKHTVEIGTPFTLEIRFLSGKIVSREITLVNRYYNNKRPRSNEPTTLNRRG